MSLENTQEIQMQNENDLYKSGTLSEDSQMLISISQNEKCALQELNDRLASYVDNVRRLNDSTLTSLGISENLETSCISQRIETVKTTYEAELDAKKTALDKERSENSYLRAQVSELSAQNDKVTDELVCCKNKIAEYESTITKIESELSQKESKFEKNNKLIHSLQEKYTHAQKELEKSATKINEQQVVRLELSKKYDVLVSEYSTLQEDAHFKENLHKEELWAAYDAIKELNETKNLNETYSYDELGELRRELQEELENAKKIVVESFKLRLAGVEEELFQASKDLYDTRAARDSLECNVAKLKLELQAQESENYLLQQKIETIEKQYSTKLNSLQSNYECAQTKLAETNEKLHNIMYDYEKVVGDHLSLDTELNAYKRILDGEEKRLGVLSRKRHVSEKHEKYNLTFVSGNKLKFESIDKFRGEFIKIYNESKKAIVLSSHKIRISIGNKITDYQIPRVSVPEGDYLTVYVSRYQGTVEKNSVLLQDIECFVAKDWDSNVKLLNFKEKIITEAILSLVSLIPSELTPKSKIPKLHRGSTYSISSPTLSPVPRLLRSNTTVSKALKAIKEEDENKRSNCNIC
ncbi:hypothetical protein HZS_7884 [Henneguya salminicola]|nr:hypothetical protein HZS_7884 [Henneguya salminicola]